MEAELLLVVQFLLQLEEILYLATNQNHKIMFKILKKLKAIIKLDITKRRFKKLFKGFSLILILVYPILPFLTSIIKNQPICDDGVGSCIVISLLFVFIVWCFWCISWLINYVVFFIHDISEIRSGKLRIFSFYFEYIWKVGRNKRIRSSFLEVLVVECFVVLLLLLIQINAIILVIIP